MTRNLGKDFYTRSRFRSKFCKNPAKENEKLKKRGKCVKEYFHNITNNNIVAYKNIWNFTRPFLINKGSLNSCENMIRK